jgi:hypothetical protein
MAHTEEGTFAQTLLVGGPESSGREAENSQCSRDLRARAQKGTGAAWWESCDHLVPQGLLALLESW